MHLILCVSKKYLPVPQNLPHVLSVDVGLAAGVSATGGKVDFQQYPAASTGPGIQASQ